MTRTGHSQLGHSKTKGSTAPPPASIPAAAGGGLHPSLGSLLAAGSTEELFQRLLVNLVATVEGVRQAVVMRRDANGNFNLSGAVGLDRELVRGITPVAEAGVVARYPLGESGWRAGAPHLAEGSSGHPLIDALEPRDGEALAGVLPSGPAHASLTVPLVVDGEVWAFVSLHGRREAPFTGDQLSTVLDFAAVVSPIAREVYLHLSAERRCRWLEASNEMLSAPQDEPLQQTLRRALERIVGLSDVDGAELVTLAPAGETLAQVGWTAGGAGPELLSELVRKKLEGGEQISIPRYGLWPEARPALVSAGLRSLAVVPMLRSGGDSAALLLYTKNRFWLPDAQTGRLLADMATTMGVVRLERSLREQLTRAAYTDSLTGLSNRRAFTEDMERLEAGGGSEQALLLLLDLDRFKEVNDTYGHVRADHALARLGGVLRANARVHDGVYRIGGDEFAVLLRGCPAVHGRSVVERYHVLVEGVDVVQERALRASIGCAHFPLDGHTVSELWRLADGAMYEDKGLRQPLEAHGGPRVERRLQDGGAAGSEPTAR